MSCLRARNNSTTRGDPEVGARTFSENGNSHPQWFYFPRNEPNWDTAWKRPRLVVLSLHSPKSYPPSVASSTWCFVTSHRASSKQRWGRSPAFGATLPSRYVPRGPKLDGASSSAFGKM